MVEYLDQIDEKKSGDNVQVHTSALDREAGHFEKTHPTPADYDDPNLDPNAIGDYEDDSPYPEVRAAVANTDDTTIPVNTLRAWIIGLMWAVIIPGLNQLRHPVLALAWQPCLTALHI